MTPQLTIPVLKTTQKTPSTLGEIPPFNRDLFIQQIQKLAQSSEEKPLEKSQHKKRKPKLRFQNWETEEVKKVFTLYNEHGSMWKMISSQFEDRTPNSIKNRFYTALRNLLKSLFRVHPEIHKIPREIISKDLMRLYHARQEFINYKGFAFDLLQKMNFDCLKEDAKKICLANQKQIKEIYDLIFGLELAKEETDRKATVDKYEDEQMNEVKVEASFQIAQQCQRNENQNTCKVEKVEEWSSAKQQQAVPYYIPYFIGFPNVSGFRGGQVVPFTYLM